MKRDRRPKRLRPIPEAPATAGSSVVVDAGGWLQNLDNAAVLARLATLTRQATEAADAGKDIQAGSIHLKAEPFRAEARRRGILVGA